MHGITTVTTKGQVTIPGPVRKALNIGPGDKASFYRVLPDTNEVVLKIIPQNIVGALAGSLSSTRKSSNHTAARQEAGKDLGNKYSS